MERPFQEGELSVLSSQPINFQLHQPFTSLIVPVSSLSQVICLCCFTAGILFVLFFPQLTLGLNLKFYFLRKAFLNSLIPIYAPAPNPLQGVLISCHVSCFDFSVSPQIFNCPFICMVKWSNIYFSHKTGSSRTEETGHCILGYIASAQHSAWHMEGLCGQGRVERARRSSWYPASNTALQ